jgi:hypothetical protein
MAATSLAYDLTCWYLNKRRIVELTAPTCLDWHIAPIPEVVTRTDDQLAELRVQAALKDALVEWMRVARPLTLGELLLKGAVEPGVLFTHQGGFYCKGLHKHVNWEQGGRELPDLPEVYAKLDDLAPGTRIRMAYHPEHLTSASAWAMLSGRRHLFVLGFVCECRDTVIDAKPYIIGMPLLPDHDQALATTSRWHRQLEVFTDEIDTFELAREEERPSDKDLDILRGLPEARIKDAFAEIIGEPCVPKDWGGERSDLLSTHVKLDGRRIATAFAFKGPATFRPLELSGLGKNGDQIERLFSESADLLVLQHCHRINHSVRATMRAFATRMFDPRLFCLIDGYDTVRILRAYRKCGVGPPPRRTRRT